jgi:hypothetical protein
MTLEELKHKLATDPVTRAKFYANTVRYYHDVGLDVTEADLKSFNEEALHKAATTGGTAGTTAIAITVSRTKEAK